jgi:hypothetical protein
MQTPQKIAVIGSGLVGTLLAIYLKKQGHTVHVYDRSPDIRTVKFSGRSINLVMSNRGWKAMEDVKLDDEIRKIGIPVDKRAIHLNEGKLNEQYYGKEGESIFSLSRGILNRRMIDLAEEEGVEFFFEHKKPLSMNVTRKRLCMIHLQRMIFKNEKLRFAILDGISFIFLLYQLFKLTKHISNSPSFCWLHGFNPWTQVYLIGKPSSCHFLFV